MGDRSKAIARLAKVKELVTKPNWLRPSDWRDVAKVLFLRREWHEVEKLIAGGGKVASGHPVMISDNCIDACAEIVAEHRARSS